jgi:signal transduction histidine kinase
MSYKIKILDSRQCSELLSDKNPPLFDNGVKLYLTTVLPGLFYSVTDKIMNVQDERFLYIPPNILNTEHSPAVFDSMIYKRFEVVASPIAIDSKRFIPIAVEGIPVGGFLCSSEQVSGINHHNLLNEFAVSDYFNLIFNINDRLAGGESIALQLLNMMKGSKSLDFFLRALPVWLVEFLGGGLACLYYRRGDDYVLRKMSGQLSLYEEMPAFMEHDEARIYSRALAERQHFLPIGTMPDYGTELKIPPPIKFMVGGTAADDLEYLLTGIVPNITSYSIALFFERLDQILGGITEKHFSHCPDMDRLFNSLDELSAADRSPQELVETIFAAVAEYVNMNRLSLIKYCQLENRLIIEGSKSLFENACFPAMTSFPVTGSAFDTVIESGKSHYKEIQPAAISFKWEYQLFKEGVRSYLLLPIKDESNLIGIMGIGSPMQNGYLKKYINIYEAITSYLARLFTVQQNRRTMDVYTREIDELHIKLAIMENLRILGELASGVFHDLNNALGAILGRCQIVLGKLENKASDLPLEKIIRDVQLIEKSTLDSAEILKRLKELSGRRKEKRRDITAIHEVINDSIEMVRPKWEQLTREKGLKIILKKNLAEDIKIMADPSELREVFINLLLNAMDALQRGGEISVAAGLVDGKAQIVVIDDGEGIPAEIINKIFEPFFTTKGAKGTGLGLPTSKKIIEEHGGRMKVDSSPGKGTKFEIELPIPEEFVQSAVTLGPGSTEGDRLRIVIVESKLNLQQELLEAMDSQSYSISIATSGKDVIKLCGANKYDILMIDFNLPDINGLELASEIKSFDRKMKIVLIGDSYVDNSISELMSRGIDGFIIRPFESEAILKTLKNLTGSEPGA